ncbi:hypothetical protein [Qaidamihabitans albus]|uniref:hypothetical protein n=1 Tax=Qaidamihabitans albus TaxID=2795733 RepID=UPI0018F14CA7|nr:hypothetical protein [Qaidamihabitans albus]
MRTETTTGRQARELLDLATDPDISAVQREEEMHAERAEIDQIIAEVDRELAAEARTEAWRLSREFTDQRRARRASRRAGREVLRALPTRLDVAEAAELGGEAA